MQLLLLSADEVRRALPMEAALRTAEQAFQRMVLGGASVPPRLVLPAGVAGTTLLMGARAEGLGLAAKTVSVFPGNRDLGLPVVPALVTVLDPETGLPVALLEGTSLTALRTGAAAGLSARLLARPDARIGALIGCGRQAETQLAAMLTACALDEVRVFARTPASVASFCAAQQPAASARLIPAATCREAVEGADVVFAATTSAEPVLDGDWLAPGAHLSGVGSFTLEQRELDARSIARAQVFIDDLESALTEAGELVAAERDGLTRREDWTPLGAVALGRAPGRTHADQLTLFKSVGHALQDVTAAAQVVESARAQGMGRTVEL
ncbi:MAG: ornithine cyclodeaminase family protein [Planctomycetes bacterium]|nr:ornithine cyclodeaminase family protein [Planctomycetota bacterium]MDA0947703.1 ornithine cyclodeaminase family protein [Planctomycetota bacterium]